MISSNYPDAEYVFIVIKKLQSLSTRRSRKAWFHIDLSNTSNLKIALHNASADKRFVFLRLIKSSHQRPDLIKKNKKEGFHKVYHKNKARKFPWISMNNQELNIWA